MTKLKTLQTNMDLRPGATYARWTVLRLGGTNKHRQRLVECKCACGTRRVILANSLRMGVSKSCGCLQREIVERGMRSRPPLPGALNPQWKGGRFLDKHGYVWVYAPEHPRAKRRAYVQEHILMVEKRIGRYLLPKETVHHKNGMRDQNHDSNLELRNSSHGRGQSVEDLVAFAKEILALYEPSALRPAKHPPISERNLTFFVETQVSSVVVGA